jgi:ATP-dependent RNA helicase DeaD
MQRYRIEVGYKHEVKPANIVGAIANEAGIDSQYIGRIDIHDDFSLVDLPEDMPRELFKQLKTVWVAGQQMQISRSGSERKSRSPDKRGKDINREGTRVRKKSKKQKLKGKAKKSVPKNIKPKKVRPEK